MARSDSFGGMQDSNLPIAVTLGAQKTRGRRNSRQPPELPRRARQAAFAPLTTSTPAIMAVISGRFASSRLPSARMQIPDPT